MHLDGGGLVDVVWGLGVGWLVGNWGTDDFCVKFLDMVWCAG